MAKAKATEIPITELRKAIGRLALGLHKERAKRKRIIITRGELPIAAIISMDDLELLERMRPATP